MWLAGVCRGRTCSGVECEMAKVARVLKGFGVLSWGKWWEVGRCLNVICKF